MLQIFKILGQQFCCEWNFTLISLVSQKSNVVLNKPVHASLLRISIELMFCKSEQIISKLDFETKLFLKNIIHVVVRQKNH